MDIQAELSQIVQPSRVLTSRMHRVAYANDASYFRLVPQAVVQPNSIGEIQSLFKFTQVHKIPMTFRAAGTSLSGQAVTDGILVDISRHWGRYSVEDGGKLIRFQPGIVGAFLNNVLKSYGRRIGPEGWHSYYATAYSYAESPGSVTTEHDVSLETNFYPATVDQLIFSSQSTTVVEDSPDANIPSVIQKVVKEMRSKKIL